MTKTSRSEEEEPTGKCDECGGQFPESQLISRYQIGDHVCRPCIKQRFPNHITEHEAGLGKISYHEIEGDLVVAVDPVTNLAAAGKSKAAAKRLLDRAFNTVNHYENNERYGTLME